LKLEIEDYELASEYYNTSLRNGIQGANTDFLICAVAVRRNYQILTTDKDFESFRKHISIKLIEYSS
jgi:predicted nucleic acid-binding protein